MVFILSFAVQGASGDFHLFPQWWVRTKTVSDVFSSRKSFF
jgi:hypothetical protein